KVRGCRADAGFDLAAAQSPRQRPMIVAVFGSRAEQFADEQINRIDDLMRKLLDRFTSGLVHQSRGKCREPGRSKVLTKDLLHRAPRRRGVQPPGELRSLDS